VLFDHIQIPPLLPLIVGQQDIAQLAAIVQSVQAHLVCQRDFRIAVFQGLARQRLHARHIEQGRRQRARQQQQHAAEAKTEFHCDRQIFEHFNGLAV